MKRPVIRKQFIIEVAVILAFLLTLSFFIGFFAGKSAAYQPAEPEQDAHTQHQSPSSPLAPAVVEDDEEPVHTVLIPEPVTEISVSCPEYTEDELFCMAAAIYNEAGADYYSDDTRRMVGYVILNRVNSSRYPDSIREVLEQRSQYGRFYYIGVKFADRHTSPYEQHAVERAYKIAKEVLEAEVIPIPDTVVYQAEFQQGTSIYKHQEGMYFCHI